MNQNKNIQNNSENNSENKHIKNKPNTKKEIQYEISKNQNAIDLEKLNLEYKTQLTMYKQAVSNYVSFIKKREDTFTSIPGQTFWGTGEIGSHTGGDIKQCEALCSKTSGCTGATYNPAGHEQPMCWLRTGDGELAKGSDTDYAIVPEAKKYLIIIESINKKLLDTNSKIQELNKKAQTEYITLKQQTQHQDNELLQNYAQLNVERNKINTLLNQYETLDKSETQGTIKITQKYYTFILLVIIVIAILILFYQFSNMFTSTQNNTYIQQGGNLPSSTYLFIAIIIMAIICVNYFT